MDIQEKIRQQIDADPVVLYMKGTPDFPLCGFSAAVVQVLRRCGLKDFAAYNVLEDEALRQGFATATDLADYLVKKGVPFRDAHEAVARAVREAEARGVDLAGLPLEVLRGFSPLIEEDVYQVLTIEGSLAQRRHIGGTAPEAVREAIAQARARLKRA